ncbi:MAG: hemolysin secretion protein D [Arcobacter sp.]|nr:hemolysin secretion protein D [Arcobacter sp.]|tara:strand:+ start:7071 stop:8375 length:1305 start_codon:yes stop_codon:yes gene_type:complete
MLSDYYKSTQSKRLIQREPKKLRLVLWFWLISILSFITWSSFADIDEIVRGNGKIIPSSKNQIIQNLEGGIVQHILVHEGDNIRKGDILVQIGNQETKSQFESESLKITELKARISRLKAEADDKNFILDKEIEGYKNLIDRERSLYLTNKKNINSKINIYIEKEKQEKSNLNEAKIHIRHLKKSKSFISQEIKMIEPLVKKGIKSKVDLLRLKKELNNVEQNISAIQESLPRIISLIKEANSKVSEIKSSFKSKVKEELNKNVMELRRIEISSKSAEDSVLRTLVKSPTNGIVQNVFINTVGGVIKPGEKLVEIVPTDDTLLVEAKIKPADIAFIYANQKVVVKFTAYDFSIYGALIGKIIKIGADTQNDKDGNSFYNIVIKTNKNFLQRNENKLPIIPGMIVNIDIITGKKSVLDYILKPILRTKQYTFTER